MEEKNPVRLTLGKHSSLAPERELEEFDVDVEGIEPGLRLIYGLIKLLGCMENIIIKSIPGVLLRDKMQYLMLYILQNHDVIKLLENRGAGAKPLCTFLAFFSLVLLLCLGGFVYLDGSYAREVLEYEINPNELDFTNSVELTKRPFRDELALLQKIQQPNAIQFLGAVTQSCPMMNVTGSLGAFLKRKGVLERIAAVRLALDIARLIEECWHDNKAKRLTFRQILTRLDTVHYSMAHKRAERFLLSLNMYVRPLTCFQNLEAMLKKDRSLSICSSRSTSCA
ncbi:hypothetical protein NC651_026724 [Populus alba x Populus x berolinensis]|nr:hypothetical protein NC651_026724 [Populus alba x Populus x berolinensis]